MRSRRIGLPKKEHFACDRVLKDLFQMDHPSLLEEFTGGVRVREFLNVEFPRVMEWRADLVALLEDDTIFHFEFQGQNYKHMAYRQGIYGLLIGHKYQRPVRQVVLYVGNAKMRMNSKLDTGEIKVSYRLLDIREIDADMLLKSGCAGDLALAMLAKGGTERLAEIAQRVAGLSDRERSRVMIQLAVLSGLRGVSEELRIEMKTMGSVQFDIRDNVILREVWEEVMAEGLAKGEARGEAKGEARGEVVGMVKLLRGLLHTKFDRVPKWAEDRLEKANKTQIERWSKKFVNAGSIEAVIGKM